MSRSLRTCLANRRSSRMLRSKNSRGCGFAMALTHKQHGHAQRMRSAPTAGGRARDAHAPRTRIADRYPSTCWRRLRNWEEQGVWLAIWRAFLSELNELQQLKWSESFLDGSFAPAKKGAAESEKPSGARGRSGWWWSTAAVFLWETTFTLHPRRKSNSRRRRSRRSE